MILGLQGLLQEGYFTCGTPVNGTKMQLLRLFEATEKFPMKWEFFVYQNKKLRICRKKLRICRKIFNIFS